MNIGKQTFIAACVNLRRGIGFFTVTILCELSILIDAEIRKGVCLLGEKKWHVLWMPTCTQRRGAVIFSRLEKNFGRTVH